MNLSQLPDRELLDKTKQLVSQERKMTVEVLWHLKAIETRRLYAVCGYSSLFEYAVKELLESMKNKSARECEKILLAKSPASTIPTEKQKPVSLTQTELRMVISDETLKNLERVRELLSHQNPEGSNGKLLELLLKMALEKLDPLQKEARAQKREMRKEHKRMQESEPSQKTQPQPTPTSPSEQGRSAEKTPLKREPISAHLRRQVLKRASDSMHLY